MPRSGARLSFFATAAFTVAALLDAPAKASEVNLALDAFGGAFRQGQGITVLPTDTWLRLGSDRITLPPFGPTGFVGAGGKLGMVFANRWILDLAALRLAGAFGPGSRTYGSVDGTIASAQAWSTLYGGLSTGVGVRAKIRRFAFAAVVHVGGSVMATKATAAVGPDELPLDVEPAFSALLHVELEACRRIDPTSRVCIALRPHIYDFGWMNGGAIALRWELGP